MIYQIIVASFSVIVVMSNIISAKMVILPLLGFAIPAGLVTYPLTFLLSDLVTEVFGAKEARFMVYTALAMNLLSFGLIEFAILMPAGTQEEALAFQAVLGLSGLRIFSSLISYVTSQLVDIKLYALIKQWTGPKFLWLRNNGSTCISQIVDTIMIDIIYLWWGLSMPMEDIAPIMLFSFVYKSFFSVAMTPLFYLLVYTVQKQFNSLSKANLSLQRSTVT